MAFSGSCVSAHLFRIGEGSFGSLVALAGAMVGFMLGFLCWNPLYLAAGNAARPLWLPAQVGHAGGLALQLAALGLLALVLIRRGPVASQAAIPPLETIFRQRWPAGVGGILVGVIGTLVYFRVGPLGVTSEPGSVARTMASGVLPQTLLGLEGLAGCATAVKQSLLSRNGAFVTGLVLGALASAAFAGDFRPSLPRAADLPRLFMGGVLLGWGAMLALGCTIGAILSVIMVGAVSGWVFAFFCFPVAWSGWYLRRARLSTVRSAIARE